MKDLREPGRTFQCLLRVWLGQDAGRVNNVKMNTSGSRLWGHELGQMAGIRVITLRKTIFQRKQKVEHSKTMMRKRVVNWKMLFNLMYFCGVGCRELPPVPGHSRLAQRAPALTLSEGVISVRLQDASLLCQTPCTSHHREAGSGFSSHLAFVPRGARGLAGGTCLAFHYVDSRRGAFLSKGSELV